MATNLLVTVFYIASLPGAPGLSRLRLSEP
jgi:hypothetical protein